MTTPLVSTHWLHDHLNDPQLIILEAQLKAISKEPDPALKGLYIQGSRPFDLKNIFRDTTAKMPNTLPSPERFTQECRKLGINRNSRIVVYDKLGIYSGPRARWLFRVMGHEQVAVLDGGFPKWVADGYEVSDELSTGFPPGNFVADFQPQLLKYQSDIIKNLDDKKFMILDARSAGRFHGTAPEPRAELESGHIPGSKSLPYTEVLENGQYKSKEALKAIFDQLELDERPLVFSCGSGITACVIELAAELAVDHPKAVYDGSWTEWASTEGLPIEKH